MSFKIQSQPVSSSTTKQAIVRSDFDVQLVVIADDDIAVKYERFFQSVNLPIHQEPPHLGKTKIAVSLPVLDSDTSAYLQTKYLIRDFQKWLDAQD